jgi:glycosyltransferase involved in cell wall biosynthesis
MTSSLGCENSTVDSRFNVASREKIRVAHLIHTMAYGGIETAILNWLTMMDKSRFEVHLFCFANPGETEKPFVEAAAAAGFTVNRIPWNRWKPVIRAGRIMAGHIRRLNIQILHCHNTYAQLVAIVAGKLTRAKTVTTVYVWGNFGWKRALLQRIDQISLRFIDQVSAHCEETFRETVKRGVPPDKLKLLICGFAGQPVVLPNTERHARRGGLGVQPEDFVLINVARFWPEKAHDVLLRAFRLILKRRPKAKLWLAGVGPEEGRIRAMCMELELDESIRFLQFRKDLPAILALADLQVHPSDMEGVPLAVCSGMAAGLPIVATAVGGLVEILRHNKSAVLVEPRNPVQLAEAVLELMDDKEKRDSLGLAARAFIEREYSLSAATARVEAVYLEMMGR